MTTIGSFVVFCLVLRRLPGSTVFAESVLLSSSVLAVGVKVPAQVMLSVLVITASVPLATVMSAELEKEATASEKTRVTVALSPTLSAVSERVKELTEGSVVSTT